MNEVKLTPLTDPSVRGVLVACADDDPHLSIVVDDVTGRKCVGKLRPASEFGVPAKPSAEVRFEANEGVPSLERVQLAIDTLGYYGQFQQGQDGWAALCVLRAHLAALKSTPAEPVQKLVPLPEGAVVFVPDGPPRFLRYNDVYLDALGVLQRWSKGDESIAKYQAMRWLNPTLYGVDAGRVECMACGRGMDRGGICGECKGDELQLVHYVKEAERLRKAIETHRHKNTGMACDHKQSDLELWSALTQPTAASGEEECPCDIERGCAKGDGVRVEGKCTLELKGRSIVPPTAASGEDGFDSYRA